MKLLQLGNASENRMDPKHWSKEMFGTTVYLWLSKKKGHCALALRAGSGPLQLQLTCHIDCALRRGNTD